MVARLVKGPETIGGQLSARGKQGRFAKRILKSLQGLGGIAGHQKTESVKLRQGSGKTARFIFFQGIKVQVAFVPRKNFASGWRLRAFSALS